MDRKIHAGASASVRGQDSQKMRNDRSLTGFLWQAATWLVAVSIPIGDSTEAMMYRLGITQIASLLLVAGFAGAAAAGEARMIPSTSGTIQSIDPQSRVVVLENGSRFTVSESTDFSSLQRGSGIVVIGGEENSDRIVVNVQGRDGSATIVTDGSVPRVGTTMNSDRVVVINSEPTASNRASVVASQQSPDSGTVTLNPPGQTSSSIAVRRSALALINRAPPRGNIVNPNNNVVRRSALALIDRAPPRNSNANVASPAQPSSSNAAAAAVSKPQASNGGSMAKARAIDAGTLAPSQPPGSNANTLGPSEPPSRSTGALSPSGPLNGQPRQ